MPATAAAKCLIVCPATTPLVASHTLRSASSATFAKQYHPTIHDHANGMPRARVTASNPTRKATPPKDKTTSDPIARLSPTRSAIAAEITPASTSVIGKRSHTSVASFGCKWYHAEPAPVSAYPTATHQRLIAVALRKCALRGNSNAIAPNKPTATKARFEKTSAARGTPNQLRWSANR